MNRGDILLLMSGFRFTGVLSSGDASQDADPLRYGSPGVPTINSWFHTHKILTPMKLSHP